MTNEIKLVSIVGVLVALLIGGGVFYTVKTNNGSASGLASTTTKLADVGKLALADSYFQGEKEAKVTVVEFADYQCPACKFAFPQIDQLEEVYKGKSVQFVFRNFPLSSHKNTLIAHNAAEEAGKQGKYWEMHHKLYENQDEWSASGPTPKTKQQAEEIIVSYARDLGLNAEQVRQAIDDNRYNDVFTRDLADGEKLGVDATPTLFVNGQKIKYVQELASAIEAELAK